MKKFHINVQRWIRNWALTSAIRHEFSEAVIAASRLNTTIQQSDYRNENGARKFTAKYFPPICELDFDCSKTICDTGTTLKASTKDYYIKQCSKSPVFAISAKELHDLDGITPNSYFMEMFSNALAAARKTFNIQLIAYFIANMGRFPDGSDKKVVSLFDVEKKTIDPFGNVVIATTFSNAELNQPIVIGGSQVQFVRSLLPISGQNQDGINTGGLPYSNYYYDQAVNEAFGGGEHLIAFDPQVLKFVSYTENSGRWSTDLKGLSVTDIEGLFSQGIGKNVYFGSIIDPVTGLMWDLDVVHEPCTNGDKFGEWRFQFGLFWDVFFMPDRVCNDPSVNGIFHFTGCQIQPTVCADVTPTPVVQKSTFEWTPPADCYPKFVNTIKLGSTDFGIEANINDINDLVAALNSAGTYQFAVDGTNVTYQGYSALNGNINDVIQIAFAKKA